MPGFELNLIVKTLAQPALKDCLKSLTTHILDRGGIVRQIEFLGHRQCPKKLFSNGDLFSHANYFILNCDIQEKFVFELADEFARNQNVLRKSFIEIRPREPVECTLQEELQIPSHRPSVQKMIYQGRQLPKFKQIWDSKTGLDFYPFHK
ncbi:hypothetical protein TCAL_01053 [Tigriopus californicus]|uniref:Small ribosomal subunit protein bS6m n=1 Tax=Tigriopus californicus TaxID=6832 RepID=A0A553P286_TIGCA|nr:small ribosomal subunit protein bS6m-like [Tigriopus californicus]TRY71794.1 hypothetical protein TCAL_01053 [Tigriopus californicus]